MSSGEERGLLSRSAAVNRARPINPIVKHITALKMYNLSKKIRSAGQFIMQNLVNTGIRAKLCGIPNVNYYKKENVALELEASVTPGISL